MATNSNSARGGVVKNSGFSLLELLLTLVIVGLIASLAGLSVTSGRRPYQVDAALRSFADIAEYALEEAQLSGTDMGVLFVERDEPDGRIFSYQWLQRRNNEWQVAPFDEDAYGRRDMPRDIELVLEVEDEPAEIYTERDLSDVDREERPGPQAVFYASGETTPGVMTWLEPESGDVIWELEWDLVGRLTLRRQGRDDEDES
jgi:general secretion pathway protein H